LYKRRFIHSIQRNTAWFDFDEHPQFLDILVENIEICIVSLLIYTITFYNVLVSPLDLSLCLCLFLFVFIISLLLVFIPLKNKSDWFYCFVVSIITLRVFSWRKLVWGKQIITCQIYQVSEALYWYYIVLLSTTNGTGVSNKKSILVRSNMLYWLYIIGGQNGVNHLTLDISDK
jgi:hypothetical protein